ncbi:ArsC family transcriptional regulator [Opitutaceae bacterium TAV5]|nr:ArsC family transcriptional regulator [Opitutaceae bacterium TAV5]
MSRPPLVIYTYAKCSTCRDATRWLRDHGLAFEERPIRETPPALAELRAMLRAQGGEIRRLFNTSGMDYRAQNLAARLPDLTEAEAFDLLRGNGNLVKRPFVLASDGTGLVGFKPDAWKKALLPAG